MGCWEYQCIPMGCWEYQCEYQCGCWEYQCIPMGCWEYQCIPMGCWEYQCEYQCGCWEYVPVHPFRTGARAALPRHLRCDHRNQRERVQAPARAPATAGAWLPDRSVKPQRPRS